MANNKKKIDQLPKINVSNAGDYLSNLVNAYNNYRAGREERRDNFRQAVQQGVDQLYSNLPENVQNGLNTAGNYIDNLTGVGSMTEYLERVDDYMRNKVVSPVVNYADKIYGKIMESKQPQGNVPMPQKTNYYSNVSNKVNNQTIASTPKQKMMKKIEVSKPVVTGEIEGGGDGTEVVSGEETNPLSVESYNAWSKLQEEKQSIVDAYDANVNYAEQMKESAYQQAEDAYKVAAREAQGNYEANKPTYGLAAEQMYKSGLTGSGYSDYLAGKAMEARTGEINAARSQQAAAQIAADNAYNEYMHEALANKISQENAFAETEREYLAAYNTEIDKAIQYIMDGIWDASIAERYLNRYAPGGAVDAETLAMIQQAMKNYETANFNSVTSAFLQYINDNLAAGIPVTEASARQWLIQNAKGITEDQINAYMNGYFKDGKLDTEAVAGTTNNGGTTTNPSNPGSSTGDQGGSGDTGTGNTGNTGSTGNAGNSGSSSGDNYTAGEVIAGAGLGIWDALKNLFGGNKNNQSGTGNEDQGGLKDEVANGKAYDYNETLDIISNEISNHRAKDVENYQQILTDLANEAFDQDAAAKIKNMANGYVVSSGKFEGNSGARTNFQVGDNFSVTIGGQSYRVESQGLAGDRAREAAKDLPDGAVFGYGSELYIKVGSTAYKIGARPGVGNGDYDRLWRTVYLEQIANIKAGTEGSISNEGANTDTLSVNEKAQNWFNEVNHNAQTAINNINTEAAAKKKELQEKLEGFKPSVGMPDTLGEAIEENKSEEKVESTPPFSDPGGNPYQDALLNPDVNIEDFPEYKPAEESAWDKIVKWAAGISNTVQRTEQQWSNDMQSAINTLANAAEAKKQELQKKLEGFKPSVGITDTLGEAIEENKAEEEKVESTPPFSDPGGNPYQDALLNPDVNIEDFPEYKPAEESAWDKIVKWAAGIANAAQRTEQQWSNDMQTAINNINAEAAAKKKEIQDKIQGFNPSKGMTDTLGEAIEENKSEEDVEAKPEIGRGVASYERDGMFDRNLKKGDNFTVEVAGTSYRVESKGEIDDEEIITAANDAGIHNGEVFTFGNGTYLKQGDKYYEVGQRALAPNQDEALREAIKNNSANVVTDDSVKSMSEYDVYLTKDPKRDFKAMDKVEFSDENGNKYRLQIRAVLGTDSAAYRAGRYVDNGEAYIHGNDIYVKYNNNAYKLAAVGGNKNGDYDRLAEVLWQNNHYSDSGAGGYKNANVVAQDKSRFQGAFNAHRNYRLDKNGNIKHNTIGDSIKVSAGGNDYWLDSGDITTGGAYRAGQSNDAGVGEIYTWNGKIYMYLGNGAIELVDANLGEDATYEGYDALLDYLTGYKQIE